MRIFRKNIVGDYSEIQVQVREMTNNDPWGSSPLETKKISDRMWEDSKLVEQVISVLEERWTDSGSTWRNIYKAWNDLTDCHLTFFRV